MFNLFRLCRKDGNFRKTRSTLLPKNGNDVEATFDFVEVAFDLSKELFDLYHSTMGCFDIVDGVNVALDL